MDAAGILPGFTGIAVHDAEAPYDTSEGAAHLLCAAHLRRELVAVTESATGPTAKKSTAMARQALKALMGPRSAPSLRQQRHGKDSQNAQAPDQGLRQHAHPDRRP